MFWPENTGSIPRRLKWEQRKSLGYRSYLFVGVDPTSESVFVCLAPKTSKLAAAKFLRDLIGVVPCQINIVLNSFGIRPATTH